MSNDSNFDILETWRYEIQIDKKIKSEDTLPIIQCEIAGIVRIGLLGPVSRSDTWPFTWDLTF